MSEIIEYFGNGADILVICVHIDGEFVPVVGFVIRGVGQAFVVAVLLLYNRTLNGACFCRREIDVKT